VTTATAPRPSGPPPHFERGQQILWHYRRPGWREGDAQFVVPGTVVADDADALVCWVPAGTPYLISLREDGLGREDTDTMFRTGRVQGRAVWQGSHTLRIAPTGAPWSAWLFWTADGFDFEGWYVNLEDPHSRDALGVYTSDHLLDLVVEPDLTASRKDEHEVAAAVEAGRLTPDDVRRIEANAAAVEELLAAGASPFTDGWETFRPDPTWPVPLPPYPHLAPAPA
jgi:predicted RNA-binding protein associated with RNAse of E/G family